MHVQKSLIIQPGPLSNAQTQYIIPKALVDQRNPREIALALVPKEPPAPNAGATLSL